MNKYFFLLVMSVFHFVCSSARGDVGRSDCEILLQDSVKRKTKVPEFIPRKKGNLYGFVNQAGQFVIPPVYSNVSFFGEDCRLIASPNESVRQYGDSSYATVSKGDKDYRIDKMGREVYAYESKDLVPCKLSYTPQTYTAFKRKNLYGIFKRGKDKIGKTNTIYIIEPTYEYLHIMEGNDVDCPMIVAVKNDKFGVIDISGNVVVPFIYSEIKRNYSWKLAGLFEVSLNGKDYFYVDDKNKKY